MVVIVVGFLVVGVSFFGYVYGMVSGMVFGVSIVVYKVCWIGGCFSFDILLVVDSVVVDGVNVLFIFLGGGVFLYYCDSFFVVVFGVMEMGVFVFCLVGNGGLDFVSFMNVLLWMIIVGVSMMDSDFLVIVKFGDGSMMIGVLFYSGSIMILENK